MPYSDAENTDNNHDEVAAPQALPLVPGAYVTPGRRSSRHELAAQPALSRVRPPRTSDPTTGNATVGTGNLPAQYTPRRNPLADEVKLEDEGVFETPGYYPETSDEDDQADAERAAQIALELAVDAWFARHPLVSHNRAQRLRTIAAETVSASYEQHKMLYGDSYDSASEYKLLIQQLTEEYLQRRLERKSQRGSITPTPQGSPV